MTSSKLSTLLWFIRKPRYYRQLLNLLSKKLRGESKLAANVKQEAAEWCSSNCVDSKIALQQLTGSSFGPTVETIYADEFQKAHTVSTSCPVEMGGPGDLNLLYHAAEHLEATRVIETGVAYGWSTMAILLSLQKRDGARLVSTDMPYPGRNNEPYVGCVVADELRQQWQLIKHADRKALPEALAILGTLDMCHYDSDKSYKGRMWAYPLLWNALRQGGWFISDDISDNFAFRDFVTSTGVQPVVIKFGDKYAGIIIKP